VEDADDEAGFDEDDELAGVDDDEEAGFDDDEDEVAELDDALAPGAIFLVSFLNISWFLLAPNSRVFWIDPAKLSAEYSP